MDVEYWNLYFSFSFDSSQNDHLWKEGATCRKACRFFFIVVENVDNFVNNFEKSKKCTCAGTHIYIYACTSEFFASSENAENPKNIFYKNISKILQFYKTITKLLHATIKNKAQKKTSNI